MPRFKGEGRDAQAAYEVAERFRDQCLLSDGSILFGNASVWSLPNLERLEEKFIKSPDTSNRSFRDKFKDQLQGEAQPITRLAAEVLTMYFLFPSNVGARRKRELVNEVLGWGGDAPDPDDLACRAFEAGIGNGGYGYNTRRPFELWFLIWFAIAWKKLSEDDRRRLLQNPWEFQEAVDKTHDVDGRQLRHILLHLLFPDHFERIASGDHKSRIGRAFSGLLGDVELDGKDQRLHAIRHELERLLPGRRLDFYWPPLRQAWYDEGDDADLIQHIQHKKQVVLYGPPGTGKTYQARGWAERIIRAAALRQWGAVRYFQEEAEIAEALRKHVHVVQLHPAYSYEDFIRGLHLTGGNTEYRPGVLLRILKQMEAQTAETRLPHVLILDEMNRADLSRMLGECFSLLENRGTIVRLPGAEEQDLVLPEDLYVIGTMNLIDQSLEQVDFALRRRFLWIESRFKSETMFNVLREMWGDHSRFKWDRVEDDFRKLVAAASGLNEAIHKSDLLGPDYEVGHTYFFDVVKFLKDELADASRAKKSFLWSNSGKPLVPVERIWKLSLEPLLRDYLSALRGAEKTSELSRLQNVFYSPPEVDE